MKSLLYSYVVNNRVERGPSHSDEPQHEVKGKITLKLLKLLKIKYLILNENKKKFDEISKLISFSKKFSKPVAIVVKKNTFLVKNPEL